MKVLVIGSGNCRNGINSIVFNQAETLKNKGVEIEYFPVKGHGITGYLKNIFVLNKHIKNRSFDLFHAHYSLSAFAASLAGCRPLLASLMGSDVYASVYSRLLIRIFARMSWRAVIVKSIGMAHKMELKESYVIPNGVDLKLFKPSSKEDALTRVGFPKGKNIIFVSDPGRPEKNFDLARGSVQMMNDPAVQLHAVFNKPNSELNWYYNAADLLLLTSRWEGSPNVVKEALACNLPIVSTNVGDIHWLLDGVDGCYLTTFDPKDVAEKLELALEFSRKYGKTKGREKILKLGLDAETISIKIIQIYKKILPMTGLDPK